MWTPGQPVLTDADRQEWTEHKRQRAKERQRQRRATNKRIDYYPSPEALEVIKVQDGDYSTAINRIVMEWSGHNNTTAENERPAEYGFITARNSA